MLNKINFLGIERFQFTKAFLVTSQARKILRTTYGFLQDFFTYLDIHFTTSTLMAPVGSKASNIEYFFL
jgi:hypothetical protein